ncbi:radical SAM family heme chaperone HemW [Ulvibacter antarcticus]|uniref:Heme chaperone HemW n=1 Tax=Ulvibacter antarcticus TaxID=442714 RepID=A0A3L9Z1K1_9FLAO|nr:radical SAM family heme chaperone HemW [Ulvibacter antarcticus]RMA66404.1 oxygen-independent coproporphyrinogen-3 oxidase [Ulvibacter antarcticus]
MSGIYIHIPFCKQACHYCDFHFSTSLKKKGSLVEALCVELELRKAELQEEVETIYFGGGTPSLLASEELAAIFETIYKHYKVSKNPEITLEANPDDLSEEKLKTFKSAGINRLSIGVQSFFEEDLQLMNRAHNEKEAFASIEMAQLFFENISIDLIYGIPGMTNERWLKNLEIAISLNVPHLSCYALTVEPKTALETFIKKGIVPEVEDGVAADHHKLLIAETSKAGYDNYEFSNFGKDGFYSKNNTAYWQGKPYLGIGPSAHGYNGKERSWNVSNNTIYIKKIREGELPLTKELLSINDRFNEYVMTGLRTKWGISMKRVETEFGSEYRKHIDNQSKNHINNGILKFDGDILKITAKGKFLSDGVASDLFFID